LLARCFLVLHSILLPGGPAPAPAPTHTRTDTGTGASATGTTLDDWTYNTQTGGQTDPNGGNEGFCYPNTNTGAKCLCMLPEECVAAGWVGEYSSVVVIVYNTHVHMYW
jgi:hypothetical protein